MYPSRHISPPFRGGTPKWRSQLRRVGLYLCFLLLPLGVGAQRVDTLGEAHATTFRTRHVAAVVQHQLDSAAILRQSISSLGDALRRIPGVNVRNYGGAGGLTTVSVRGMGAAHTQVLMDGLPIGNAQQGSVDLSRYLLSDLAGLSLTVGDSPLLLAPARTLAAATLDLSSIQKQAVSSGEIGLLQSSWNSWCPTLLLGRPRGLTSRLSYTYADNNYPYVFGGERLHRLNSRLSSLNAQCSTRDTLRQGTLDATAHYWFSHRQLPGPVIYYNPTYGTERMHEQMADAHLRWSLVQDEQHAVSVQAAGKYSWQDSRYRNEPFKLTGPTYQHYVQHEAYATLGISRTWRLGKAQLGAAYASDYTFQALTSNLPAGNAAQRHTLQQVLSLRYELSRLVATARLMGHVVKNHVGESSTDEEARSFCRLTPSFSVAYRVHPALTLRAHYKEYFRSPTFTENYYYHYGTPSLLPELTRQGGAGALFSTRLSAILVSISADGYVGCVKDRIVSVPYNLFIWRTMNKEFVRTAGADVAGQMQWQHRAHLVSLSSNYSYQLAESQGFQLPYTPRHSGAVALSWENPSVNSAISVTAASSRTTTLLPSVPSTILPRYYEINVSLWRSWRLPHHLRLLTRAEVLNLTNHRHFVIARYPMPGISYRLSLILTI